MLSLVATKNYNKVTRYMASSTPSIAASSFTPTYHIATTVTSTVIVGKTQKRLMCDGCEISLLNVSRSQGAKGISSYTFTSFYE